MTHNIARRRWPVALTALVLPLGALGAAEGARAAAPTSPHHAPAVVQQAAPKGPPIIALPPPSHFVRIIDNPWLPMRPGTRWFYRGGSHGEERNIITVLHRTRQIVGIKATVVRDVVRVGGQVTELTRDWFAQDSRGRVWYLGEATKKYDNGHVSTEGSWETGVHGAKAGIAMFAHPKVGPRYRQEYLAGTAEDIGQVLDFSTQVTVPFGHYRHVLMTEDTTSLDPTEVELKFYARGVGNVLGIDLSPQEGRTHLIRMVKP